MSKKKTRKNSSKIKLQIFGCDNKLTISTRGRRDLADGDSYCSWFGSIPEKLSTSTKLTLSFQSNVPLGSRFHCEVTTVVDDCSCGRRKSGKVVGGNETFVNEFPAMAGIVDGGEGIVCGATISKIYLIFT